MEYRKFGMSDLATSALGIGGLHFGVYCDQARTTEIIHNAIGKGINFIDTAPMYGNGSSERFIGRAVRGSRHKVMLSTKVGLAPKNEPDGKFSVSIDPLTGQNIRRSLENSLSAFGTDYIDLYQLHAFDPNAPIEETMCTLDSLVREGKTRFIGCSNYDHNEFEIAFKTASEREWANFVSFQVQYNLIERRAERDIMPLCGARGIGVICNRALARGVLTGKYKKNEPFPSQSRASTSIRVRRLLSEENLNLISALDDFAKERGRSLAELAISWLLSKEQISTVLVGVRDLEQLKNCVEAVDWKLSDNDLNCIDEVIERLGLTGKVKENPEVFFES